VGTIRLWLVIVALAGLASTVAAAACIWLLVTQPLRAADLVSRAF
jgi:hypothetical protein